MSWDSHWQCPFIGGPLDGQFTRLKPGDRPIPVIHEVVEDEKTNKYEVCEYILEDLTGWDDKVYWYYRHTSVPDSDKCFELMILRYCEDREIEQGDFVDE